MRQLCRRQRDYMQAYIDLKETKEISFDDLDDRVNNMYKVRGKKSKSKVTRKRAGSESVTQGGPQQEEEFDREEIKENRMLAVVNLKMKKQRCKSNPSLPERTATLTNRQRHEDIDVTKHQKTHICHRSSMDTDTAWLEAELQHMELVDIIE